MYINYILNQRGKYTLVELKYFINQTIMKNKCACGNHVSHAILLY